MRLKLVSSTRMAILLDVGEVPVNPLLRIPICCFCDQRLLGLKGQDCILPRYFLANDEAGRRIMKSGWIGAAHVSCLVQSQAAGDWATELTGAFSAASVTGARVDHEEGSVVWVPGADDFRFVMQDGSNFDLSPGELESARPMPGQEGWQFVTRTRNELGSVTSPDWEGVQCVLNADERGGIIALVDLLKEVCVPVHKYDRRVIDTALVTVGAMRPTWQGKVVMGAYKRRRDVILVHHDVVIPVRAYEAAMNLIPIRRGQRT